MLACSSSGSGRGFRSRGLLAASGFTQIWLHLVFYRVLVLAVRLKVRVVFFAHEAQVTISVFVCLATLFCCDLLGSGTASPTVGGQAGCNSNSINALGTPASNKVGVLASSAIFLEWHAHNLACSRRSKR